MHKSAYTFAGCDTSKDTIEVVRLIAADRTADALGIADMSARLLAGTLLEHPSVIHRRVKHVEITASPAMGFNVDGEMDTAEKVTCTIHPAALRMIVGPEYPHPTVT